MAVPQDQRAFYRQQNDCEWGTRETDWTGVKDRPTRASNCAGLCYSSRPARVTPRWNFVLLSFTAGGAAVEATVSNDCRQIHPDTSRFSTQTITTHIRVAGGKPVQEEHGDAVGAAQPGGGGGDGRAVTIVSWTRISVLQLRRRCSGTVKAKASCRTNFVEELPPATGRYFALSALSAYF